MERVLTAGIIFICFGQHLAWAKIENEYFLIDKSIELKPPSSGTVTITNIQWRHNDDIAAEWSRDDGSVDIYRNFKGRANLNTTTGYLVIRNMTEAEAGNYFVEINNSRLDIQYVVKSVEEPPTPKVWLKPGADDNEQIAVCEGNVDKAGPVTYWWDTTEDGSWVQLDWSVSIMNNEIMQRKETISCKIVSRVAERASPPQPNPFFPKPGNPALGALAIIPIIVVVIGLAIWKKDVIRQRLGLGENPHRNPAGAPATVTPEETSLKTADNGN